MAQTNADLVRRALRAAETFIVNGVALGFIRMPDPSTPDPAHDTLPLVRAALSLTPADLSGCVVVPKELTKKMLRAVNDAGIYLNMTDCGWRIAWRTMLNAALTGGDDADHT